MEQQPTQLYDLEASSESLVEQETQRIDRELRAMFDQSGSRQEFELATVAELLNTNVTPMILAMQDNGMLPKTPYKISATNVLTRPGKCFDQAQVLELNSHPFVRTLSISEASQILDVSINMVSRAARDHDIEPVIHHRQTADDPLRFYHGYFNFDQIMDIREKLTRYNAPEDHIPESMLRDKLNLSGATLAQIQERLELEGEWFHNPERGHGEQFFAKPDVAKLIQHLRHLRRD